MPKQLLCLLLILFSLVSFSQIQITGVVKDSLQPIAYANIILTDNKGKTITEDDGSFKPTAQTTHLVLSKLKTNTREKQIILHKITAYKTLTI